MDNRAPLIAGEKFMKRKLHRKQPHRIAADLESKLLSYVAAASAAGVGVIAVSQAAEARIIYTPADVTISNSSFYLGLDKGGKPSFLLSNSYAMSRSGGFGADLIVEALRRKSFVETSYSHSFRAAAALYAGAKIPPGPGTHGFKPGGNMMWAEARTHGGVETGGKWQKAVDRYLGLKFQINGKTHYGWARLSAVGGFDCAARLTGYAYETVPNKPIVAGRKTGPDVNANESAMLGRLAAGRK
jgi:hypothetical protein